MNKNRRDGGLKSAEKSKKLYGDDFFVIVGRSGGSAKVPKGFAKMPFDKVSAAGKKGGKKSRRSNA